MNIIFFKFFLRKNKENFKINLLFSKPTKITTKKGDKAKPYHLLVFYILSVLSQFQSYQTSNCQHDADNPETSYDFCFVVAFFLKMMVQWRHQKQAVFLGKFQSMTSFLVFKIAYLQNY